MTIIFSRTSGDICDIGLAVDCLNMKKRAFYHTIFLSYMMSCQIVCHFMFMLHNSDFHPNVYSIIYNNNINSLEPEHSKTSENVRLID